MTNGNFTYDFPKNITDIEETDNFWSTLLSFKDNNGSTIFSVLAKFVLTVLYLPHSNTDCERIFSKINRTKTKSRNKVIIKTVYSLLMTCEGIQYNTDTDNNTSQTKIIKENCVTFIPPKQMLKMIVMMVLFLVDVKDEN